MNRAHVIVVGASSGIGEATCNRLREHGYLITGLARRHSPAAHLSLAADASVEGAVASAIHQAIAEQGNPVGLVYCAGDSLMGVTHAIPSERAKRCMDIGFWGLDEAIRAAVPSMASKPSTIVAVLSIAAVRAIPHEAYYGAVKAAAARYLDTLRYELGPSGIRVRYVCPGYIPTGFFERGEWHGMARPLIKGSGVTAADVASRIQGVLEGGEFEPVMGWRERAIALADRIAPGLYDAVKGFTR